MFCTLLAANSIFSIALKAAYTYVSWTSNFCRILQKDDVFISCDICKLVSIQFSRLKAWKLLHRYLDCHSILLIFWKALYHWFIMWLKRFFSNYDVFTLIAQLDFYLIDKALSMLIYELYLVIKVMVNLVLYDVILTIISSWLIDFMKSLVTLF